MYDDDSKLWLEFQYRSIEKLLLDKGRYPTREEVIEEIMVMAADHSDPKVIMMN